MDHRSTRHARYADTMVSLHSTDRTERCRHHLTDPSPHVTRLLNKSSITEPKNTRNKPRTTAGDGAEGGYGSGAATPLDAPLRTIAPFQTPPFRGRRHHLQVGERGGGEG